MSDWIKWLDRSKGIFDEMGIHSHSYVNTDRLTVQTEQSLRLWQRINSIFFIPKTCFIRLFVDRSFVHSVFRFKWKKGEPLETLQVTPIFQALPVNLTLKMNSCQLQCFSVSLTFVSMVFLWRRQNSSVSRNNRVSRWNSTRRRRQRLISRLLLSMQVVNEMGLSLNLSFETQMDWHEMTNLVCRLFSFHSFHSWLSWWHDPRVTLMPLTSMSSLLSCATYRSWLWCPSYSFDFCSGLPKSALIMKRKRKTHFETEEMIIKIRERVQRRVEGVLSLSS